MPISATIIADSVAPCGTRVTTIKGVYPRSIHDEILTHRALSRSSASSRAIPTKKFIQMVIDDPFIPEHIGANQKGMQAAEELTGAEREEMIKNWLLTRDDVVARASRMLELGAHKQVINRVLQPWMWMTVILTGTEWDNWDGLRDHPAAEPHFQRFARLAKEARHASVPRVLKAGEWHLPFFDDEDRAAITDPMEQVKISMGRTARVSYLTHDGRRDYSEDIRLHDDLVVKQPLHASPAEHVCQAMDNPHWWAADKEEVEGDLEAVSDVLGVTLNFDSGPDIYAALKLRWEINEAVQQVSSYQIRRALHHLGSELSHFIAVMQSGNFYGFRQHRKSFKNEHIGGPRP